MRFLLPLLLSLPSTALATVCANADVDIASAVGEAVGYGSTIGGRDSFSPVCQPINNNDVSFEWIAPTSGTYIFDTEGSALSDTILAIYASDCTTTLACDDDSGAGFTSSITFDVVAGERYLLVVDGYATRQGPFNLNILLAMPAVCAVDADLGAAPVATVSGDTCGAGDDVRVQSCVDVYGSPDRTYLWTAPSSGMFSFDVATADFDAVVSVRDPADCGAELACDGSPGAAVATLDAVAGTTYAVVVEGAPTYGMMSCGTFDLRVYEGCPDADQDAVCDDVDLCVGDNAIGDLDGDGNCNDRELCTGYDPSGDSDADGLCDDADFDLVLAGTIRGAVTDVTAFDAPPRALVTFMASVVGPGAGPCHPTAPICSGLLSPRVLGSVRAGPGGAAVLHLPVPLTLAPGLVVYFQAVYGNATGGDVTQVEQRLVR